MSERRAASEGPRRVVIDAPRRLRLEPSPLGATVPAGWARLRPRAIGICGSDLHVLAGHHPFVAYPVAPGHELVAEVIAVGADVDPSRVGERVALEPSLSCGRCRACRRGEPNLCETLRVMGFQAPGGMADAFDAPADRLHPLPASLSDDAGALVEPTAVATHAVRLAGTLRDLDVAVVGSGTIGLLCAQAARADGAAVTVSDVDPARRAVAAALGFETDAGPPAGRYDVVLECVGVEAALRGAVAAARKGGTVLIVGVHGHDPRIQAGLIQDRELRLQGTLMYTGDDVRRAIELLDGGAVDVGRMITDRLPLADVAHGFARAAAGGSTLKVLLVP